MAELTLEAVREIIQDEVGTLRNEMREGFATARRETLDAINQVVETVQALSDEDRDEVAGIRGRLHSHNERIARLERSSNLR
jgi:predicted  nucleic acid-binding Zn-ribbon protein